MYSGLRYRLLVLPDYIFASEIERYLFCKMRIVSWGITIQQIICVTSLVVLRPIYLSLFINQCEKSYIYNSFKFYSHRNQYHCVRLLIEHSPIDLQRAINHGSVVTGCLLNNMVARSEHFVWLT